MKIYVDSNWRICALRSASRPDLMEFEIDCDKTFENWCDAAILCFCYKIYYKVNEAGDFVLDENGNKIVETTSMYPGVDSNIIQAIQHLYEQEQEYITTLQLALAEQYETNLALLGEVTSTQLALTEFYEGLEV